MCTDCVGKEGAAPELYSVCLALPSTPSRPSPIPYHRRRQLRDTDLDNVSLEQISLVTTFCAYIPPNMSNQVQAVQTFGKKKVSKFWEISIV
jgi:hypothetical protein